MHISKVKNIRVKLGHTQATLAEKSKVSVRTIQRLESSAKDPKGYTLQALAAALEVEPSDLQQRELGIPEINNQNNATSKLRLLNLSALCFIGMPFGNLIVPLIIWNKNKNLSLVDEVGRKVISFQILWTICIIFILILSPFAQLYFPVNFSLMLVLSLLAVVVNLFFILKTARALMRQDYDILPSKIQII